jgi:hypothetical protein
MRTNYVKLAKYYPAQTSMSPKQRQFQEANHCSPETPCKLLPCTNCGRAFKNWFESRSRYLFKGKPELVMVSIAPPHLTMCGEHLSEASIRSAVRWFRELIEPSDLASRIWLGGIDISYNIGVPPEMRKRWSIHGIFITTAMNNYFKKMLRSLVPKGGSVEDPVVFTTIHEIEGALRYAMQDSFYMHLSHFKPNGEPVVKIFPLDGTPLTELNERLGSGLPDILYQTQ